MTANVTYTATFTAVPKPYYLKGTFNSWSEDDLMAITDGTVVTAAKVLEPGVYTFKINIGDKWYGNDSTINDTTVTTSADGLLMSSSAGNCTLNARVGGEYVFNYDTAAKKLIVLCTDYKDGVQDDGYLYIDGVKQLKYQLIEFNGDYYFINDGDKYAKNARLYLSSTYVAGTGFEAGCYDFGDDGKMILRNGLVDDSYYVNGKRSPLLYRFIEIDGDWYFIYDGYKIAKNAHLYISGAFLSGTDFEAGYFDFDDQGRYYVPAALEDGAADDGFFYINGVKQSRYQLIESEGDWYFINDGDKYAKNTKLYLSNTYVAGTNLSAGLYEFGADGKMIVTAQKNGPQDDGYFYINGARYKYAKNTRLYISGSFLSGTDFAAGYYTFGADGAMIVTA